MWPSGAWVMIMKMVTLKNFIIFFIVGILGIAILAIRIKYFSSSQKIAENESTQWQEVGKILQDATSETKNIYNKITENIASFKEILTHGVDIDKEAFSPDAKRFQEEIIKKIDEKNIEKLDPYIKDMKNVFSAEWIFSISTVKKGIDEIPKAMVSITSTSTCAIKTLEWYEKERSRVLEDILFTYNQNAYALMCQKKILFMTEKYIVIDSCSNDVTGCEEEKVMQERLEEYFKKIPNS